jgi:hypothetical protein
VVDLNPQGRRGLEWTVMFSPPLEGFFTGPWESWFWGDRHAVARGELGWAAEMALLPGIALIVLASAGLFFSVFRPRHRVLLGAAVVGTVLLGLGSNLGGDGDPGYLTLSKHLPGWDALRTPGRLMIWTSLLLAILAAGFVSAASRFAAEGPRRAPSTLAFRAALLIPLALVFVEGINRTPHPVVPKPPAAMSQAREPLLVLPSNGLLELNIMLWSTDGFPRIANGLAGFEPTTQTQTRASTVSFPDQASVAYLRSIGIRSVLVLPNHLVGTPWEASLTRPIEGLGITRQDTPDAVLFHLD